MSDITRWKVSGPATRLQPDANGPWVALVDYYRAIDRLIAQRDAAQAEVERLKNAIDHLTSERDEARAERDAAQRERERVQDLLTLAGRELSTLREALRVRRRDQSDQRDKALACVKRLTHQNIERLKNALDHRTSERDEARAEVERLRAERDQMATHPRGREVGRFGLDGHYLDAMEPERPTDEDIWREAFITMLPSFPWEKAAEKSDCVLVEYRKRWPR